MIASSGTCQNLYKNIYDVYTLISLQSLSALLALMMTHLDMQTEKTFDIFADIPGVPKDKIKVIIPSFLLHTSLPCTRMQ